MKRANAVLLFASVVVLPTATAACTDAARSSDAGAETSTSGSYGSCTVMNGDAAIACFDLVGSVYKDTGAQFCTPPHVFSTGACTRTNETTSCWFGSGGIAEWDHCYVPSCPFCLDGGTD